MGFQFQAEALNGLLAKLGESYRIFAPVLLRGSGAFSDTDMVRYGPISAIEQVVFDQRSAYSAKEALLPTTQSLFFFTEDQVKEADPPAKAPLVFLRSCDLQALSRLDAIYLRNGAADSYYQRVRERVRVVLMVCEAPFEGCFCAAMGTNRSDNYDLSIRRKGDAYLVDCKAGDLAALCASCGAEAAEAAPVFVSESAAAVRVPQEFPADIQTHPLWDEYDSRCINCGRCNFVCPTCTCYTMQDLFYSDNGRVGERRRVWASCMVDGYSDVAGGGSYRQKNGQRMRFKVLHKIRDHKLRFGEQLCVGCGRCDAVCPEYISYTHTLNRLSEEVSK